MSVPSSGDPRKYLPTFPNPDPEEHPPQLSTQASSAATSPSHFYPSSFLQFGDLHAGLKTLKGLSKILESWYDVFGPGDLYVICWSCRALDKDLKLRAEGT